MNTIIKLCGMMRPEDIAVVNRLKPDWIGFVFAKKSRRYVSPEQAETLKRLLDPGIRAAGVFVDEAPEQVAALLDAGIIDSAQLHGHEDADYISRLRALHPAPIIQAFRISSPEDVRRAELSPADRILLDAGAGSGTAFDWSLAGNTSRPFFLAGGLEPKNVAAAIRAIRPYGVDVSSGIETDGRKDPSKMEAFVAAVREEDNI